MSRLERCESEIDRDWANHIPLLAAVVGRDVEIV